ncbi:MFS transporter [Burkholderia ubonensis]|uniref:MFS transporter n=1 Tax=Burkholderia ubonensis TaxID=101571 RepID=UPI0018DFC064|nr:MFS transporter [Burkholderia ubonensis]
MDLAAGDDSQSRSRNQDHWRIVCAWITMYVVGADLFVISPLLPLITTELHTSTSRAGWLVSSFSIAYALTSPFIGKLSDKHGRRLSICCGLVVFAAANLATACATSFTMSVSSRIVAGIAVSAITPSIYAAMGDQAPEGRRAHWLSIAVSGLLTALWTSAPLGALLAHAMPWRLVFVLLSASAFLLAWPNLILWPVPLRHPLATSTRRLPLRTALSAVSPMIAWGAALYGFYTYLGVGLDENPDISASLTSLCFVGWGVGAILGNHLGGWAADRIGPDRTASWSLIGMMLSMGALGFSLHHDQSAWLVIGLFGLAVLSYPFQPAQQSRLAHSTALHKSSLLAWNSSALYAGMTIGSVVYGYAIKQWPFPALPYVGMVIAGIAILLSLLSQHACKP